MTSPFSSNVISTLTAPLARTAFAAGGYTGAGRLVALLFKHAAADGRDLAACHKTVNNYPADLYRENH